MHITVIYYPNGFYKGAGSKPNGFKQYTIGITIGDILVNNPEVTSDDVIRLIQAVKKNKSQYLIKYNKLPNGIKEFCLHYYIVS